MNPRFEPTRPNDGFDPYTTPPWLMVPVRGSKRIRLVDGPGLTVTSTSPGVASVQEITAPASRADETSLSDWLDRAREALEALLTGASLKRHAMMPMSSLAGGRSVREFLVRGHMKGRTFLEARLRGGLVERLEVAVKPLKFVKVAFNFVQDNAGHSTGRAGSDVDGWLATMNEIYTPQANIVFRKNSVRRVTVNHNLGAVVRFSAHLQGVPASEHEWTLVTATGDGTADFNVFFVWEYEQDINPGHDHADAGTLDGNCIFEDRAGREVGETLAHEAGHYLGANDVYDRRFMDRLMYGITDDRGRRITRDNANVFNP